MGATLQVGTPEERASEIIRQSFNVLDESADYKNRGKSKYVRRYFDAEMKDNGSKSEVFENH